MNTNEKEYEKTFKRTQINSNATIKTMPVPVMLKIIRLLLKILNVISTKRAGKLANYFWHHPQRIKKTIKDTRLLQDAKARTIRHRNIEITSYCWGEGPSVMLVHGWDGYGAQMSFFIRPLVDAGFKVILFDAPAHGQSPGKTTDLPELSESIQNIAQCYGESLYAIISHSFGSSYTLYAAHTGLNVKRIICISPSAAIKSLLDKFVQILDLPESVAREHCRLFEERFGTDVWQKYSPVEIVKHINQPGLIIHDLNDQKVSWEEGKLIADAWKNSQFIATQGLGHYRILQDTEVIRRVVYFLTEKNSIKNNKQ